jgi:hypothetical protein
VSPSEDGPTKFLNVSFRGSGPMRDDFVDEHEHAVVSRSSISAFVSAENPLLTDSLHCRPCIF